MSRIRSIKQQLGLNEDLSKLSAEAHLFSALLLPYADDEGYFNANPKLVHAALCPLRELSVSVPDILRSLHGIGYIELFSGTDGREYGHIVNFLEHQRVSHPTPSKIKEFRKIPEDARSVTESFRPEGKGIEGKGGEVIPEFPPDHIHPNQFAAKLLEEIQFPKTPANIRAVASAIECEVQGGRSKSAAYEFVLAGTKDARDEGFEINTFFFSDCKYRTENRANAKRQKRADGFLPPQNAPADYVPESKKRKQELEARRAQGL